MQAQAHPDAPAHLSPEITLQYTWVRSNAPVAACDCFSLNGGSFTIAQPLADKRGNSHIAAVFEATVVNGSVNSTETTSAVGGATIPAGQAIRPKANAAGPTVTYNLTLSVFTAGARYRPLLHSKWNPFGQILIGVANANGSLVEGNSPAANDSTLNFASQVGGGLDYRLHPRLSLRVFEANYLLTTTTNGVNDYQNNLAISAGITYRLRKP
jgi:peptidoglycan-associated lipoprotein